MLKECSFCGKLVLNEIVKCPVCDNEHFLKQTEEQDDFDSLNNGDYYE